MAENKLRETAEAKLPEIRNNIQFLEYSVSDAKEILYSDIKIKLSEKNRHNKEYLVEGVSHSFDSYVSCSYLLKLYKFVEIIYKDWERGSYYRTFQYSLNNSKALLDKGIYNYNELKEEFSEDLFPQEINTRYDLSLELYKNCNFKTIITDKPTIGALFIASNENYIDFVTSAVAHHSLNNNSYLKELLYKNRNNDVLKNSNLIEKFKKFKISYARNTQISFFKLTPIVFILSFISSFIAVLNIEKYAYTSIIPPLLISLGIGFLSSIVWWIFSKVVFYAKTIFNNIDKVKLFISLIMLFALIPASIYIYRDNYIKKLKKSNIEYINNIGTNILAVSNFIANKEFTNAYNKTSKIALVKPYPIVDIEESKQIAELKISLYDNIATNFINDIKYKLSNYNMTLENYNYLLNAYNEKDIYKKITNKENRNNSRNFFKKIPYEIDNKRHEYLLSQIDIIEYFANQNNAEDVGKLISSLVHPSKEKFVLDDKKKFIFFENKIRYDKYWYNKREELLTLYEDILNTNNFIKDIKYKIENDAMTLENYNYLLNIYNDNKDYYKEITNKYKSKKVKEFINSIPKTIDDKRHIYLLSQVDNYVMTKDNESNKQFILSLVHPSKEKFVLDDKKKFIFFENKIRYDEYWNNKREELLTLRYNTSDTNNFIDNIKYKIENDDMTLENYNYLLNIYKERKDHYKEITDKEKRKQAENFLNTIPETIDAKRHQYLLSQIDTIKYFANQNNIEDAIDTIKYFANQNNIEDANKLISSLVHPSKEKFVLDDKKKFIFFENKIRYDKYWNNKREELLTLINN